MQWLEATKHLNGFVHFLDFSPQLLIFPHSHLHISPKVPILVKQSPPRIQNFILLLNPTITVKTQKDFCVIYNMRQYTLGLGEILEKIKI